MLTDQEKNILAKKNYQDFLERMAKKTNDSNKPINERRLAYVFFKDTNERTKEDYHWTDHTVTPTGFYRWIHSYKKPVTNIILDDKVFNELVGMVENATSKDTLQFDETIVVPYSRKVNQNDS